MKIPSGYILVPEEHPGTCRGCAFFEPAEQECLHPSSIDNGKLIGCAVLRKIFKKDPNALRKKILNKLGYVSDGGIIPQLALNI